MAKEQTEAKLKLIHLLYVLLAAALCVGVVIGAMRNQQGVNTIAIEKKVEKDIFTQHQEQQRIQSVKLDKTLSKMNDKLDDILKK